MVFLPYQIILNHFLQFSSLKQNIFFPLNKLLINSWSQGRQAVDEKDKEKEMSSLQAFICPRPSKSKQAKILLKDPLPESKQIHQSEKVAA